VEHRPQWSATQGRANEPCRHQHQRRSPRRRSRVAQRSRASPECARARNRRAPRERTRAQHWRAPPEQGHGRRLRWPSKRSRAFALAESRDRLLSVVSKDHVATAEVVSAVERRRTIIAVLASRTGPRMAAGVGHRGRRWSVSPRAPYRRGGEPLCAHLTSSSGPAFGTRRLSASAFMRSRPSTPPTASRPRSLTSIATATVTSLLHDVGKLVLLHAYPGYRHRSTVARARPRTPAPGSDGSWAVDHARGGCSSAGGAAGLDSDADRAPPQPRGGRPRRPSSAFGHGSTHYERGGRVSPAEMLQTARTIGLGPRN